MEDKQIALHINALMYSICFDITDKTPKVDKWMKQIRKGLKKLQKDEYWTLVERVHESWKNARMKVIDKGEILDVKMSELLMTLYNKIPEPYNKMHYTEKTFEKVVNSFDGCRTNKDTAQVSYSLNGRELADAFLKEIGVDITSPLARRKAIIKNNLILEGKI